MEATNTLQKTRFKVVAFSIGYFLALIWVIHIVNYLQGMQFSEYGLYPRTFPGLLGILTCPLLHGDWWHLIGNSMSFAVLGGLLLYFYPKIGYKIIAWSWLAIGVLVWLTGRPSYHIGASGIIYAMAAFLFLSGIIRKYYRLMAVSLIVVFMYGSMIWGVLPGQPGISWESHLSGMLVGLILAVIYRKQGPQKPPSTIDMEEDDEDDEGEIIMQINANFNSNSSIYQDVKIQYQSESGLKKNKASQQEIKDPKDTKNTGFRFSPKIANRKK